jgi:hypothetical protein
LNSISTNEFLSALMSQGMNEGFKVRMRLGSIIHLNTIGTSEGEKEEEEASKMKKTQERAWASEHGQNFTMVMSAKERRAANVDARDISILE